jgi:hypothetical protein
MMKAAKKTSKVVYGKTPVDQLYKAVHRYVERHGGNLIVIGGVEIQEWPGDVTGKFKIAVNCLGKKPTFKKAEVA